MDTTPFGPRLRHEPLPLTIHSVPPELQRNIAEHLTFTDAVSLMLSSSQTHAAIQKDRLLRLDEISPLFQRLQCNQLVASIQFIDYESAEPRSRPLEVIPTAVPSISIAGHSFTLRQSVVTHALRRRALRNTERARQAQLRARQEQRGVLAQRLTLLEPQIEAVAFHFAAERLKGPRPVQSSQAMTPVLSLTRKKDGWLHSAIETGDVQLVRAGLREFLSLPVILMPNDRKVAWLPEPHGKALLASFGQHRCGLLKSQERGTYNAIAAYVDEIVSSNTLTPQEKLQVCLKPGGLDIFQHAMGRSNPAVAAMLVLGIHESSADQHLKQFLLGTLFDAWRGRANCVNFVIEQLSIYAYRAPAWVGDLNDRLHQVKATTHPYAGTKD
ncbi:MAG: hypothetical protein V4684_15165 [Pseudomonadota bacterium]